MTYIFVQVLMNTKPLIIESNLAAAKDISNEDKNRSLDVLPSKCLAIQIHYSSRVVHIKLLNNI